MAHGAGSWKARLISHGGGGSGGPKRRYHNIKETQGKLELCDSNTGHVCDCELTERGKRKWKVNYWTSVFVTYTINSDHCLVSH